MTTKRLAAVCAAIAVGAGMLGATPAVAGGNYVICPSAVNAFVWDGGGDGTSWNDAGNWDVNCTPGLANQLQNDVVTIPVGANVRIEDGESAYVLALHNAGSLTITPGGVLKTIDASESKTTLLQGLLFGTGRFSVTGTMTWQATTSGAATMSTRRCSIESCVTTVPPGTTVIEKGATLAINGRGVNLSDGRVIENHGTVQLSGDGYIAADYGTAFRNLRFNGDPVPKFVILNDRGYYQGFSNTAPSPSDFVNTGRIIKQSGSGTSVIDADYAKSDSASPYTGAVTVQSGRLSVLSPSGSFTNQALVKQGAAFANGSPGNCAVGNDTSACESIRVSPADPQAVALALTKAGPESRRVTLQELPGASNPGGFGVPVYVSSPNAVATTTEPMVLRIQLDAGVLGASSPADVAQLAQVQRKASTSATYQTLPSCEATSGPTSTQACVARGQSVSETAGLGGDVVLVVKTLQNSRYRVGRILSAP